MRVLITEWALDSYLEMVGVDFSVEEYWDTLRPDVERLFRFGKDPAFQEPRFWGPAEYSPNGVVEHGFKMKWHNVGPGRIQLRLCVAVLGGDAWLCHAYSKTDARQDYRMGVRFLNRVQDIHEGRAFVRGELRERGT